MAARDVLSGLAFLHACSVIHGDLVSGCGWRREAGRGRAGGGRGAGRERGRGGAGQGRGRGRGRGSRSWRRWLGGECRAKCVYTLCVRVAGERPRAQLVNV
mgnify:CR=1 FL=1